MTLTVPGTCDDLCGFWTLIVQTIVGWTPRPCAVLVTVTVVDDERDNPGAALAGTVFNAKTPASTAARSGRRTSMTISRRKKTMHDSCKNPIGFAGKSGIDLNARQGES